MGIGAARTLLVTSQVESRKPDIADREFLRSYVTHVSTPGVYGIYRVPRLSGYSLGWRVGWRIATRSFCVHKSGQQSAGC